MAQLGTDARMALSRNNELEAQLATDARMALWRKKELKKERQENEKKHQALRNERMGLRVHLEQLNKVVNGFNSAIST